MRRIRRFFSGRKRRSKKPISSIQVELTNHCNYHCPFCPQSQWRLSEYSEVPFNRAKGFMDFDLFKRVIDEANMVSNEVNISFFGEHMMHPEFLDFMDYLGQRNPDLRVVMNTNLSFATKEIFQKLIDINLTDLRLSIDAATSETYDIVRPGEYYVNLDGKPKEGDRFETICSKAEYWHSLPYHRPTRHVFTVNSRNIHEIDSFVKRWLPLLGEQDIILTKSVLTYGGKISDKLIQPNPCNVWESNMLTVDWTGRVSPCNLDTNMDLCIGTIQESKLIDLLRNERFKKLESMSKSREIVPCKTCIDSNNWSRNIVFRKGDVWKDEYHEIYAC